MKLGSKSYWLAFLTFLLLAVFGSRLRGRPGGSQLAFVVLPREQSGPVRAFKLAAPLDLSATLGEGEPSGASPFVKGPVRLVADGFGDLFVIDDGDGEVIKQLSSSGAPTRVFSELKALGMQSVTGLTSQPDRLWVADLLASSLYHLDRRSGTWKAQKLAFEPYQVETLGERRELVILRIAEPQLFSIVDIHGIRSRSFGILLKGQSKHALALDGYVAQAGDSILFAGKYLGVLASFSPNGKLNYLVRTIAPPEDPIVVQRGRSRWVEHGAILACYALATRDETIFALAHRAVGLRVQSVIDLYRANDGTYIRSLMLPEAERWESLAVGPMDLFAASERRVVRWPKMVSQRRATGANFSTGRTIVQLARTTNQKGNSR